MRFSCGAPTVLKPTDPWANRSKLNDENSATRKRKSFSAFIMSGDQVQAYKNADRSQCAIAPNRRCESRACATVYRGIFGRKELFIGPAPAEDAKQSAIAGKDSDCPAHPGPVGHLSTASNASG